MEPVNDNNSTDGQTVEQLQDQISVRLLELVKGKANPEYINKEVSLRVLERLIVKAGVKKEDISTLFDLIYDFEVAKFLSTSEKSFIVTNLLIPGQEHVLPVDLIYRIISNTGIPQKYYKHGKVYKTNKLPTSLQVKILEWLVCSIHLFGSRVFETLNRMLPILFNYLSYEYSRPYIANLIFLSISNGNNVVKLYYGRKLTSTINAFKPWHVQIVVDLLYKFPFDECLRALIALFKYSDPELDLSVYSKGKDTSLLEFNVVSPKIFVYPNYNYLEKLKDLNLQKAGNSSQESIVIMKENFKNYDNFNSSLKKNKRFKASGDSRERTLIDFGSASAGISIADIHSIKNLVESFYDIKHIDLSSTLSPKSRTNYLSEKYKRLYLVLQYFSNNKNVWEKLDRFIKFTLLDDNMSLEDYSSFSKEISQLFTYGAGLLETNSIDSLLASEFRLNPVLVKESNKIKSYSILKVKLDLLIYLSFDKFVESYDSILSAIFSTLELGWSNDIERKHFLTCTGQFFRRINQYLSTQFVNSNEEKLSDDKRNLLYKAIGCCVGLVNNFVNKNYKHINTSGLSAYFSLLRFVRTIPIVNLKEGFNEADLMIPPPLAYNILLSKNPFLVSEICGYLAFCKNIKFKGKNLQALQNAYIVDYLNFIWRNKAFTTSTMLDTFDSLLLTGPFIDSVRSLHIFNHSNFITSETIGDLFHDPCWSYITAQIVWDLEDKKPDINVRHEGPISEQSITRLNQNPDSTWLDTDYKSLKISILNRLDAIGYRGLCDLLFNSLTSLVDQREFVTSL